MRIQEILALASAQQEKTLVRLRCLKWAHQKQKPMSTILNGQKTTEKNAAKRKAAQKELKRLDDRSQGEKERWSRYGRTAGMGWQAVDKIQSSVQSREQGEHKRDEVYAQMSSQINQNVQKGFETQKDTAASDVNATIAAYGAQGLGQANLHRPV